MAGDFTHFNKDGQPQMVNVGEKAITERRAVATGRVIMAPATLLKIKEKGFAKGDVLSVAQLAGIMGAKQTSSLIPLCHPLGLDHVAVELVINEDLSAVDITADCRLTGKTGVEMEALTAVSVAALTLYDMCKSVDKAMRIDAVRLIHKSGGKSGTYEAE